MVASESTSAFRPAYSNPYNLGNEYPQILFTFMSLNSRFAEGFPTAHQVAFQDLGDVAKVAVSCRGGRGDGALHESRSQGAFGSALFVPRTQASVDIMFSAYILMCIGSFFKGNPIRDVLFYFFQTYPTVDTYAYSRCMLFLNDTYVYIRTFSLAT